MERDQLLDYIFNFKPMLHKKIFKDIHGLTISRQQMRLLFALKNHNGKPMKYYGEKLMISKPNLTKLVNTLIEEGYLIRKNDNSDRRIINLYLTKEGEALMSSHMREARACMLKRLKALDDEDIHKLCRCFKEIELIFSKLD